MRKLNIVILAPMMMPFLNASKKKNGSKVKDIKLSTINLDTHLLMKEVKEQQNPKTLNKSFFQSPQLHDIHSH